MGLPVVSQPQANSESSNQMGLYKKIIKLKLVTFFFLVLSLFSGHLLLYIKLKDFFFGANQTKGQKLQKGKFISRNPLVKDLFLFGLSSYCFSSNPKDFLSLVLLYIVSFPEIFIDL